MLPSCRLTSLSQPPEAAEALYPAIATTDGARMNAPDDCVILRVYVPDLEKMKTWKPTNAEIVAGA